MKKYICLFIAAISLTASISVQASASESALLPYEDLTSGKNSNAYLSTASDITEQARIDFVNQITPYAVQVSSKTGVPASAIIGMAIIESGYGTTRIAINANNLFGIKVWGVNPLNAWQLKGQPSEDYEKIPVLASLSNDQIIFDESNRKDNWYRAFTDYEEAINYLAVNLLSNKRYQFAITNYKANLSIGWSKERAVERYLYRIADMGYNHLGGEYYQKAVGKIINDWDLTQYDK